MSLDKKYKNKLLSIINTYLPNCTVYLFGSRATDTEYEGSDIDLALDAGTPIAHRTILKILDDIDDTTIPLEVDIVDLQTAPTELKSEIKEKGIQWTN